MATEETRTVITADGTIITFDVEAQTVLTPMGIYNADIEAAAVGGLDTAIAAYHYNHNVGSNL